MTQFIYSASSVTMEIDPLHPRSWDESQAAPAGYDSAGNAYAYDCGAPVFREETLTFPAISWSNLTALTDFIENTLLGSLRPFTWLDRGTSRAARYKSITWQQVSPKYWQVALGLEVQL